MHWFNPSHLVLLIEIIKGDNTSDDAAKAIYDLSVTINKKPVKVNKDVKGLRLTVFSLRYCEKLYNPSRRENPFASVMG